MLQLGICIFSSYCENTEEEKRPEIITKIFEMKRPKRNQEVDDCPITDDMMKLLGDICTED